MAKTIAIRLDEELHTQAVAVAQLEGITLTDLIRHSIENYLAAKRDSGELAERAQAVLDDIERDAKNRRDAISGLLGTTPDKPASRNRKPQ